VRSGLYVITLSTAKTDDLVTAVAAAIRGGAVMVQYREKLLAPALRYEQARVLRDYCRELAALFIVNDDPHLAKAVNADGVHLGVQDASFTAARDLLGANTLIGVSCYNSLEQARQAQAMGADYVAFGSFFPSATKPAAVRADINLLHAARSRLSVPIAAIGGITPANGNVLVAAGAYWLAVIDGVFGQGDPEAAARNYTQLFDKPQATPL
jgi:thiamine-phosphate pyrophosphorylase